MQDSRGGKVLNTQILELEKDSGKANKINKIAAEGEECSKKEMTLPPMPEEATHRVIGYLPEVGTEFIINGLKYKVTYLNSGKGRFTAQIMGLKTKE